MIESLVFAGDGMAAVARAIARQEDDAFEYDPDNPICQSCHCCVLCKQGGVVGVTAATDTAYCPKHEAWALETVRKVAAGLPRD